MLRAHFDVLSRDFVLTAITRGRACVWLRLEKETSSVSMGCSQLRVRLSWRLSWAGRSSGSREIDPGHQCRANELTVQSTHASRESLLSARCAEFFTRTASSCSPD